MEIARTVSVGNTLFIPTYGDMMCWEHCVYPNLLK